MQKRWTIKPQGSEEILNELAASLNINNTLANLLVQRGITTFAEAKTFFRPELSALHDPFLMKGMYVAVERIKKAVTNKEKILVYGDYDVDGTTSVALVYTFLKSFYANVDYYIPDRYSEGYGISFKGIDFAKENNFSLIIALDCGIKSVDKIKYANEKNIEFIICDHHRPGNELPAAVAILNPKQDDCPYPFKELSGCGIGFKLVQAYAQKAAIPFVELEQYLDLTAISIAADIVPINGENRILAYYGLQHINNNPRHGIKVLLDLAKAKKELTISDIVFIIGPRINAAGRIENGKKAVELLISDNTKDAEISGKSINITNTERKTIDTTITQQAFQMIDSNEVLIKRKTTVLFHKDWHKGVVGIVASRLTEKYYRPTIVLAESNGMATGSARSVKDFDVYEAIDACSDLLEQFGGHKYAAGLTLKLENLEAFQAKFEEIVCSTIQEHMLVPEIEIDAEINLDEIDPKFFRVLKQFAPFGPGNMSPVFLSKNLIDKGFVRIVGTNHLKMDLTDPENDKISFPAIAFNQGPFFDYALRKNRMDVCYCVEENEFNGNVTLQLNVKDIKPVNI